MNTENLAFRVKRLAKENALLLLSKASGVSFEIVKQLKMPLASEELTHELLVDIIALAETLDVSVFDLLESQELRPEFEKKVFKLFRQEFSASSNNFQFKISNRETFERSVEERLASTRELIVAARANKTISIRDPEAIDYLEAEGASTIQCAAYCVCRRLFGSECTMTQPLGCSTCPG